MCTFITGVLPSSERLSEIKTVGSSLGFYFQPVENDHVQAQLRRGEVYVRITRNRCDCDTILGSCRPSSNPDNDSHKKEREIEKLRRKGWSEAKVAQHLFQKGNSQKEKHAVETESRLPFAETWTNNLKRLIESGVVMQLGILLHWYSGPLSGRITIRQRKTVSLTVMDPRFLLELEDDVLYDFVK